MNTIKAVALAAAVASASAAGLNGRSFTNATTSGVVYTTEVVTVMTTYCPAATTLILGNKTYAVTTPGMLTITDCPCTIRKPAPAQPTSALPGQDECAKKCNEEYNACRIAPDANMSFCASKLADCVHYNPFGGNGTFVNPTACSAQPTGGSTETTAGSPTGTGSPPPGTAPTQPTGGNPTGTATGTATGTGSGNATATGNPPPSGAAGQQTPALALLALCALALL